MTVNGLFRRLLDDEYRACQIEFKGEEAMQFMEVMSSIPAQPQLLLEDQALIAEHKHVIFLAKNTVPERARPRVGDKIIGSLCGRTAIVPRESMVTVKL